MGTTSSKEPNTASATRENMGGTQNNKNATTSHSHEEEDPPHRTVTAVVIGAGQRGKGYSKYSMLFPDKLKIVAVAEPREKGREKFMKMFTDYQCPYALPEENVYETWEQVASKDKLADLAIIATQDRMHKEPAIAMAKKGYHILLEKPMAVTEEDCEEIVAACKEAGVMVGVCHVLRYYPQFKTIKNLIDEGAIGEVVHIQHTEPVGFYHFAHSYVRGNWRNEAESSSSLLAKCCHDLDLISYWMGDIKCKKISSFGSLMHFTKENKPEGASDNCMDCPVHEECAFSAQKTYLHNHSWPTSVVMQDADIEDVGKVLKTSPYGRCVYSCDNDVMSNQVVNMEFTNGATSNVTMIAFSKRLCARETIIYGTKGEIRCNFSGPVDLFTFQDRKVEQIIPMKCPMSQWGHGGADFFLIKGFVEAVATGDQSKILVGAEESLESHKLVFAAERARLENKIIEL